MTTLAFRLVTTQVRQLFIKTTSDYFIKQENLWLWVQSFRQFVLRTTKTIPGALDFDLLFDFIQFIKTTLSCFFKVVQDLFCLLTITQNHRAFLETIEKEQNSTEVQNMASAQNLN